MLELIAKLLLFPLIVLAVVATMRLIELKREGQ